MNTKEKYILVVLFQVIIILVLVFTQLFILFSPYKVYLKIAPVDPKDYLRGDYITFRYNISNISKSYFRYKNIKKGDIVYVVLRKTNKNYWSPWYVQKTMPQVKNVFIKGRVVGGSLGDYDKNIYIKYGIEEYYIPEGAGENMSFFREEVLAEVKLDKNGNPLLKKVLINGKKWP